MRRADGNVHGKIDHQFMQSEDLTSSIRETYIVWLPKKDATTNLRLITLQSSMFKLVQTTGKNGSYKV